MLKSDASPISKTLGGILIVLSIAPIPVMISHSFVPSDLAYKYALYGAVSLTVILTIGFALYGMRDVWESLSRRFKIFMVVFSPVYLFWVSWFNFSYVAPHAYTIWFGEEATEVMIVQKYRPRQRGGRRRGWQCLFQLNPVENRAFMFYYCIPQPQFTSLPDGDLEARATTVRSPFGVTVTNIDVTPK